MDSPIPVRPLSTQMASAVKKAAARVRVRNTATTTGTVSMLVPFPLTTLYPQPRKEASSAAAQVMG